MLEVFLYRCDRCSTVIALDVDKGRKYYIDECPACHHWSDHERVYVAQQSNGYKESQYYVKEEDDKEGEVDEHRPVDQ